MKTLHLTLKKQWFDMIFNGEKREEYRDFTPYWISRLLGKQYDSIEFRNGYGLNVPWFRIELKVVVIGNTGKRSWGAPSNSRVVFILHLGKLLQTSNRIGARNEN